MILIAPKPNTEYGLPEGRKISSDHRQVIYDVDIADMTALTQQGCVPVRPFIVVHNFPEPASLHCFTCGAFIEKPEHKHTAEWLQDGCIHDFLFYHYEHAEGSLVEGWPRWPAKGIEAPRADEPAWPKEEPSENRQAEGWAFVSPGVIDPPD